MARRGVGCCVVLFLAASLGAEVAIGREPWADSRLPPLPGLQVWLDAARIQGADRLPAGAPVTQWQDSSGHGRHLLQSTAGHQPVLRHVAEQPVVRFDGLDDYLARDGLAQEYEELTVLMVATPFANGGAFSSFLAINRDGVNDYQSGLNVDQGAQFSKQFDTVNVEGPGFGGAADLAKVESDFGIPHLLAVVCKVGSRGVQVWIDGQLAGERDRQPGTLRMDRLTLGARCYNHAGPPDARGFLEGDIAEVLVFDRALGESERKQVEQYLGEKHQRLLQTRVPRPAPQTGAHRLVSVPAPPVQMLVPGFTIDPLPVALPNVNNVRYRADGKLVAVGYNGNIYLLSDTDGDGLEDRSDLFWESQGRTVGPIGMALTPPGYPHGNGVFLPNFSKLSLIVDDDGDDRADREQVIATGWKPMKHHVDSFGVAVDPRDGSVYFGLGTEQYNNAYVLDQQGKSHYQLGGERGTILRVAPDLKSREVFCTGIRFSIGMAFNARGDLFCTDQEGATWLPNGNPLDELLNVQRGRHYGFPPRHPRHLPEVIDEPSTFDYEPQHQSTCGLQFNDPVPGGATFGPAGWRGDAIVTGYSRGKLYRTKLIPTDQGYVAQNQLIGSLTSLTVDACVSPRGDLIVATHSGGPDWGTGPSGPGQLYRIRYAEPDLPQPVLVWPEGPYETQVAFDRPLAPESLRQLRERVRIEYGAAVAAADRLEVHRPGYAVVQQQMQAPRYALPVHVAQVSADRRTIILTTGPQVQPASYALTLFGDADFAAAVKRADREGEAAIPLLQQGGQPVAPRSDLDLAYTLHGVQAEWRSADATRHWRGWLPHLDMTVARQLTAGSARHDELWSLVEQPGQLKLTTQLDLTQLLRPAVQPGSQLEEKLPAESATVRWRSSRPFRVVVATGRVEPGAPGEQQVAFPQGMQERVPVTLEVTTGGAFEFTTGWWTAEDDRLRPFPLRRFFVPWAQRDAETPPPAPSPPELAGGSWSRGRRVFLDPQVGCAKCHALGGEGALIGPDLTNVVHRDYQSVLRDIADPNYAINPEYITHHLELKDGRTLAGVMRQEQGRWLVGNDRGEMVRIAVADIETVQPRPGSTMPTGLPQVLGPERLRDLLTFLLTPPPRMPEYGPGTPPPPRKRAEVQQVLAGGDETGLAELRPLRIVLVAGKKDHGPGEHDYPAWQTVWHEWLSCADRVQVERAERWPSAEQLATADVLVLYQQGEWNARRAAELDAFQARGGGLVLLHYAVDGGSDPAGFAERIGLAWKGGVSKFRHGALSLQFAEAAHPITRNFQQVEFVDETYWGLVGDERRIRLLASAREEARSQPIFWTVEPEAPAAGRTAVSILGHYSWTFDDPLFRLLILRSMAWAAREPVDRFNELVWIGGRLE